MRHIKLTLKLTSKYTLSTLGIPSKLHEKFKEIETNLDNLTKKRKNLDNFWLVKLLY